MPAIACPHCQTRSIVRNSCDVYDLIRELRMTCENVDCGHVFVAQLSVKGKYLQEGKCPACDKRELFTWADKPFVLRCGRENRCGETFQVKPLYPEIFDDWSKRHVRTRENPHAAADAYLQHARGFDLQGLRGCYLNNPINTDRTACIDHSRTADVHAISLVDFEKRCADAGLRLPCATNELKRLLKTSKRRKFVDVKPVNSRLTEKTTSCWIFRNPDHQPAPAAR